MKDILEFLFSTVSESDAAAAAAREGILSQLLRHPNLIPFGPSFDKEKMPWFVHVTTIHSYFFYYYHHHHHLVRSVNPICVDLKRRVSEALGKTAIGNQLYY